MDTEEWKSTNGRRATRLKQRVPTGQYKAREYRKNERRNKQRELLQWQARQRIAMTGLVEQTAMRVAFLMVTEPLTCAHLGIVSTLQRRRLQLRCYGSRSTTTMHHAVQQAQALVQKHQPQKNNDQRRREMTPSPGHHAQPLWQRPQPPWRRPWALSNASGVSDAKGGVGL